MITGPDDVTGAVLSEVERAKYPRTKELLAAGAKHLHAFVRETKLTEAEFQHIARIIARLGQLSNEWHNEVVLIAGSLGVSSLVCLQNNGLGHYVKHDGAREPAPDPSATGTWYSLDHRFVVEPGDNSLPKPPITGKATDGVPVPEVLERTP